jgi:hypothetical protein
MTKLASVKEKLLTQPLICLTAEELELYFLHRVDNLLRSKMVLVRRELEYLLGETGPGSGRIDPELVGGLTDKRLFTGSLIAHFPRMATSFASKKTKLQDLVVGDLHSAKSVDLMAVLFGHYVESLEIRNTCPLVFGGSIRRVPVHIIVNNGGWIMPDRILFEFVSQARQSRCLAVVIAKKIHGILFPLFKSLGIVGTNTYQTYVSANTYRNCGKLQQQFRNPNRSGSLPKPITYNEQLEDLHELSRGISDEYYEGNVLKLFLEETLPRVAPEAYSCGLDESIKLDGNFYDVAMRLKDEKLKARLLWRIEKRTALLAGLENLKSKKD